MLWLIERTSPTTRCALLRTFGILAWTLSVGCQLPTDGLMGPITEREEAGAPAPASICDLECDEGLHCVSGVMGPSCIADAAIAANDAGRAPVPPAAPDASATGAGSASGACNLACARGSECLLRVSGPVCVVQRGIDAGVDAGAPPPVVCDLLCTGGSRCVVGARGPSCIADPPSRDAGQDAGHDAGHDAGTATPCGANTCSAGQYCCNASCGVCAPLNGFCIATFCEPDAGEPLPTCATTNCPRGTYCDDLGGNVECIPEPSCETTQCEPGSTCELVQVQCIRAPCPPLPTCTPQVCNLMCKQGQHCTLASGGPKCEPNRGGGGEVRP